MITSKTSQKLLNILKNIERANKTNLESNRFILGSIMMLLKFLKIMPMERKLMDQIMSTLSLKPRT